MYFSIIQRSLSSSFNFFFVVSFFTYA
uniref:Uncharacterized protein n=1 Tax=Rhizophora mucronata TaxID=61149 RepID=A0A2P2Q2C8_RHIMU